jgi:K+-transporting ATPase KdpF subunit
MYYGMYWLGGAVSVGLLIYLVVALVRAEDF